MFLAVKHATFFYARGVEKNVKVKKVLIEVPGEKNNRGWLLVRTESVKMNRVMRVDED